VLGQLMGRQFLDLDDCIEQAEGCRIAELFAKGESTFRKAEQAALRDVLERNSRKPMVLALGGGAFVQPENLQLLDSYRALSIFLDAPVEELWARCLRQEKNRPLLQDENHFRQLYENRRSSYMASSLLVDTKAKDVRVIANEISERITKEIDSQGE
jgi:shikimate kinase